MIQINLKNNVWNKEEFEKIFLETKTEKIRIYKDIMPDMLKTDEIVEYLDDLGYFTAPSSFKRHGAWIGGNFDHSLKVTQYLLGNKDVVWSRKESPYIIGMFHDLCKSDVRTFRIVKGEIKISYKSYKDRRHSEKSLEMLSKIIEPTLEEKLCIYYHMGEHNDDYEYRLLMEKMIQQYPTIQLTQEADTRAALEGV